MKEIQAHARFLHNFIFSRARFSADRQRNLPAAVRIAKVRHRFFSGECGTDTGTRSLGDSNDRTLSGGVIAQHPVALCAIVHRTEDPVSAARRAPSPLPFYEKALSQVSGVGRREEISGCRGRGRKCLRERPSRPALTRGGRKSETNCGGLAGFRQKLHY